MKYALQKKGYGLGNFIMTTPALQLLNQRVGVYFSDKHIASLYQNCPFIKILENEPKTKFVLTSEKPKRNKGESDIHAYCRMVIKKPPMVLPNTYVDKCNDYILERQEDTKHIALFHGCLGKVFKSKKDIGRDARQMIIDKVLTYGYVPVLLGSSGDFKSYWSMNNLEACINYLGELNLRQSVSVLDQCDYFISNDTGLYHVAGALKKPGLVLWHKTNMEKNMCLFGGINHIQSGIRSINKYSLAVDSFLETLDEN